jgi:hypothetical protein
MDTPLSIVEVICKIPKLNTAEHKTHNFEVTNSTHPNLDIITTLPMFQNVKHVVKPVINKTHEIMLSEHYNLIAQIKVIEEVYHCKI